MESKKRKFEQTLRKYKGEWVLIEFKELDESLKVVEGKVVAHSPKQQLQDQRVSGS